ncbi:MAG: response regulator [Myxococcales bacterium]|nr:response regulator [Myxococcales bacterium]
MTMRAARILVVEDEGITAWDIEQSLGELGFEVVGVADSAHTAVEMARGNRPDLILMDVHLRGADDGVAAARQIRDELRLPVVYLTANRDRTTLERAKATDPYAYLHKPFHRHELQTAVELALQRHGLERSLRERERLLATTLRCIRDGVVTTDPTGRVVLLNPAAETLTGWAEEDARGCPVQGVLDLVDLSNEPRDGGVQSALGGVEPDPIPAARVIARNGQEFLVSAVVAPVVDGDDLLGSVAVMHDIERERRLLQQLEHAERLAAFGTMAAGVAHEINNPLAFVVGNLHYAIGALSGDARAHEQVQALKDALIGANRISRIVEDFRSFGRSKPDTREKVRVVDVLRYAITVTEPTRRHRFEVELDMQGDPVVYGDESRLGQVVVNLLINAAHAMEGQGHQAPITVRAGGLPATDQVFVEVTDRGCGMDEDQRQRALEPFYTTKPQGKGTGLGLSVAHGIVEAHGGSIEIRSQKGEGSTFCVVLPAFRPSAKRSATSDPTRGRVLLIDDEPALLRSLRRVLERRHEVETADGAEEALRRFESGERFDLVLCDVQMPRMSGLELLERLAEHHPDVASRVTLITGGPLSAADLGPDGPGLLKKPFDPAQLLAMVDRLVSESKAARTGQG